MDYEEAILKRVCKEMEEISQQISSGKFDDVTLDRLDKLAHTKKSMLTIKAMEEAEEYENQGYSGDDGMGKSGRRGRSPATGRYVSRDMGPQQSYAQGYSEGYSEAMNRSGHYPMMGPYPERYRY